MNSKIWESIKEISKQENFPITQGIVYGRQGITRTILQNELSRIQRLVEQRNQEQQFLPFLFPNLQFGEQRTRQRGIFNQLVNKSWIVPEKVNQLRLYSIDYVNSNVYFETLVFELSRNNFPMNIQFQADWGVAGSVDYNIFIRTKTDLESFINSMANSDNAGMIDNNNGMNCSIKEMFLQMSSQRSLIRKQPIKPSKNGKGNDLYDCKVIDNDLVYVPPSGKCLISCLEYKFGLELIKNKNKEIQDYLFKKKIYRYNIRLCDFNSIGKIVDKKLNYYRKDKQEFRYPVKDCDICLALIDNHYFIIKDITKASEAYKFVQCNLTWQLKEDLPLDVQENKTNFSWETIEEMRRNTYQWDFETYTDKFNKDYNQFKIYANGLVSFNELSQIKRGMKSLRKHEKDMILINRLNAFTTQIEDEVVQQDKKQNKKTDIKKLRKQIDQDMISYFVNGIQIDNLLSLVEIFDIKKFSQDNQSVIERMTEIMRMRDEIENECEKEFIKDTPARIYEGEKAIIDGLKCIDQMTAKPKKEKGKFQGKAKVILMAHNSAKFDSFMVLQEKDIKIKRVLEKNGLMKITVSGIMFKNADFILIDTMKFIQAGLGNMCKSYNLPRNIRKTSLDHEGVTKDNWKQQRNEWKPYLNLDVISLAWIWDDFITKMFKINQRECILETKISESSGKEYTQWRPLNQKELKNKSSIKQEIQTRSLDIRKYCGIPQYGVDSLMMRTKKSWDLLNSFSDPVTRTFIQRANRGGRVIAKKRTFKTELLDKILVLNNATSIDQLVGKKLCKETENLIGSDYLVPFDATSLYPSAMALEHSKYPNIKSAYHQNPDEFKIDQQNQYFVEVDILVPKDLEFVPFSKKYCKVNQDGQYNSQVISKFQVGNISKVVFCDVDLQEAVRFGCEVKFIHRVIAFKESFKASFRDFVLEFFSERAKVKNQDSVMGDLYKLLMNSAYGKLGQKPIETVTRVTTLKQFNEEHYDDNVLDQQILNNGQVIFTKREYKDQKFSPHHLACYVLAYSKQIMNNFIIQMNAHKKDLLWYMDTDSMYLHNNTFQSHLSEVKDGLGGGKNDYGKDKLIIYAEFMGLKQKVCYAYDTRYQKIVKLVTYKGTGKDQFKKINEKMINEVYDQAIQNKDKKNKDKKNTYVDNDQWKKDKQLGVLIPVKKEDRQPQKFQKKISVEKYLEKMNLVDNCYKYKYVEEFK